MARPKGTTREKMQAVFVRLPEKVVTALKAEAIKIGIPMSTHIRMKLMK